MLGMERMEEQIGKIEKIMEDSKTFALLLDENFKDYEILAREALMITLKENGLNISLFPNNTKEFNEKWEHIIPGHYKNNSNSSKTTSILIPKEFYNIKEISFEEDNDFVSLNLDSNQAIDKENIIFKEKLVVFDAVFCFGQPNYENLNKFTGLINIPPEEKVIYITQSEDKTISKKVSEIIEVINKETKLLKSVSTLLFASLLKETGAEKEKEESLSFVQLFGRALARTRNNESLKSVWAFISQEDLAKTGNINAEPEIFYKIIKKYREIASAPNLSILIWQEENKVQAMVSEKEPQQYLSSLAQNLKAKIEDDFFIAGPFKSFSEAELRIQQTIKDIVKII